MSKKIKKFIKTWGITVVEIILALYNVIATAQVFGFNLFGLPTNEKVRFGIWVIIVILLAFEIARYRIHEREIQNALPNVVVDSYGVDTLPVHSYKLATSSFGFPSGTFAINSTSGQLETAYHPPSTQWQYNATEEILTAYIDFCNTPKIKTPNSIAKGLIAKVKCINAANGKTKEYYGRWDIPDPNRETDRREIFKVDLEASGYPRRMRIALKSTKEDEKVYAFSRNYMDFPGWRDPTMVLEGEKYLVIVELRADNEIKNSQIEFELINSDQGLSFKMTGKS